MRCSGWSSLAISACRGEARLARAFACALSLFGALFLAAPASAHVVPVPAFLPSQSTRSIELAGPNERERVMTGFKITTPAGLEIERAHEVEGWAAVFDSSSATWTGGTLAPDATVTFGITLKAASEPGVLTLTTDQLYADGAAVSWPVAITVTPAEDTPSENLVLAAVVGVIGLLLVVAVALLARRRRQPPAETAGDG
jgi:hypothetical protein